MYYAVETIETGEVFGLVAITGRDRDMVYTKLVDESMGPSDRDCPPKILNLLSEPAPNEWAAEWREDSRKRAAAKAAMPKVKAGDTIKFAEPIKFQNGFEVDTLKFVKQFTFSHNGYRFRLPKNWKTRYNWEVVT
jgi:hypothetical protein